MVARREMNSWRLTLEPAESGALLRNTPLARVHLRRARVCGAAASDSAPCDTVDSLLLLRRVASDGRGGGGSEAARASRTMRVQLILGPLMLSARVREHAPAESRELSSETGISSDVREEWRDRLLVVVASSRSDEREEMRERTRVAEESLGICSCSTAATLPRRASSAWRQSRELDASAAPASGELRRGPTCSLSSGGSLAQRTLERLFTGERPSRGLFDATGAPHVAFATSP